MIPATRQNQVSTTPSFPSLLQPTNQSTLTESKPRLSTSKKKHSTLPRSFVLKKRRNVCQVIQKVDIQITKASNFKKEIRKKNVPRTPNSSRPPYDRDNSFSCPSNRLPHPSPSLSIFRVLLFVTAIAYQVKEERWRTTREEKNRRRHRKSKIRTNVERDDKSKIKWGYPTRKTRRSRKESAKQTTNQQVSG